MVHIPAEVVDFDSFCRWTDSDEFPERWRFAFLGDYLWVDLSMEEMYTHNQVREVIGRIVGEIVASGNLGRWLPDGMQLTNAAVNLSTEPDGMFVSYDALQSGRVQRLKGRIPGIMRLEGSPEMVLEVVSATSVRKDTVELRDLYWQAGIREYWLVDVRETLQFEIMKHGPKGYTSTRRQAGGWLKSTVFGHSFQLTQTTDRLGDPIYQVAVRP
jgi:Uma2 family endonuclease